MFNGEVANTNVIAFALTRPRLESSIYRTRGEHANHYTTDAFLVKYIYILYSVSFSGKGSMGTGMFVIMTQEEDDIKKIL